MKGFKRNLAFINMLLVHLAIYVYIVTICKVLLDLKLCNLDYNTHFIYLFVLQ